MPTNRRHPARRPIGDRPAAHNHRKEPTGVLHLLLRPPVRGLLTLAFLARTTAAVLPITLLLALAQAHGYARAAAVGGGYTLVLALCAPLRGRLLDRYGAHRMLTLMGAVTRCCSGWWRAASSSAGRGGAPCP